MFLSGDFEFAKAFLKGRRFLFLFGSDRPETDFSSDAFVVSFLELFLEGAEVF